MLLLTGYEPFGDFETNPSGEIARQLDGTEIADHTVNGVVLPVEFDRAAPEMHAMIDEYNPAVVVATGLAGGRPAISVERVGINVNDSVTTPDNAAETPDNEPIEPSGPPAYFATLPVADTVRNLLEAGIPGRLSNSAGTHLCNNLLYATRHYVATNDLAIPAGFVHLPLSPEEAIRQADEPTRGGAVSASMPLDMQVRALEIVFETAVESIA